MSMILTLNQAGLPLHWASWQEAVTYKAKGLVVWEYGEKHFVKLGGNSRLTGTQSTIEYSSILAVKGSHFPTRTVPALNNKNLFARDRHLCAYCGNEYADGKLTRDHIHPRAKGGPNNWMNVVTACKKCNNAKGDTLIEHWKHDLLYVPYVPSREEALIMKNRNMLADQMDFLQKMLPSHSRLRLVA